MGRKPFREQTKTRGPGRKAKKQKDPVFPKLALHDDSKPMTRRQKIRAKKQEKKIENIVDKQLLKKTDHKKNTEGNKKRRVTFADEKDLDSSSDDLKKTSGFSDENASWLKPVQDKKADKSVLFESDSGTEGSEDESCKVGTLDEIDDDGVSGDDLGGDMEGSSSDSDDEKGEEEEDLLPIEKSAKKLKKKLKEDELQDEKELVLNIGKEHIDVFKNEVGEEGQLLLPEVMQQIKDIVIVLSDFNRLRDPEKSREEYLSLLKRDLCFYYSYNEFLMENLINLFPLSELLEYLDASEVQRPLTIRTNSLKTRRRDLAQALINRGVNLDPLGKWTQVGLVIYSSAIPIGATPEYLSGNYMVQGASSMLPVMALAPQPGERVLDMCAAPGGKASHIAAVMKNTGVLIANDSNIDRTKGIIGNFHRLGVVNSIVTNYDGRKLPKVLKGFDRVLLDAPCTGTGVVSKDHSVKINKDKVDVQKCCVLQKELILAAIDCLSVGHYLVYSTCSVLPEENECIVNFALRKRHVKLVPTGLDFGTEGFTKFREYRFSPDMKLTRRFYPHTHNMDGFYVSKLQKLSDGIIKKEGEEAANQYYEDTCSSSSTGKEKQKKSKKRKLNSSQPEARQFASSGDDEENYVKPPKKSKKMKKKEVKGHEVASSGDDEDDNEKSPKKSKKMKKKKKVKGNQNTGVSNGVLSGPSKRSKQRKKRRNKHLKKKS